jgi:NAD(P)-dependent dehydrogenase (short-subunit alcohol dehydrogenase family)
MRLENKVAIITGSARGMGRVFALRFAREGAKLTICDVLDCEPVAREIKAIGGEVLALKTDVTSEKDTEKMVKKTADSYGRIDILVNNAAVVGGKNFSIPPEQAMAKDWNRILEVNVTGTFLGCKAVIPYMKEQGGGKIINIASTAGLVGVPLFLHYSSSKGGVITMTHGLAAALGDFNINVNAVAPGAVMTEAMQGVFTEGYAKQHVETKQLIKRSIQPEDVASAVVFLASDEANMITGQTLAVNAGEYLH